MMPARSTRNTPRQISTAFQKKTISAFREIPGNERALLLCWGSVAKKEMGLYSDLDLIIVFLESTTSMERRIFIREFKKSLELKTSNRLDLLEAWDLKTLRKISSIDGTDRQALLFASPLWGNPGLKAGFFDLQKSFREDTHNNLREFIHTYFSVETTAKNLYSEELSIKFSRGCIRYFSLFFLLAKTMKDGGDVRTTEDSMDLLRKKGYINQKDSEKLIFFYRDLIEIRNRLHREHAREENGFDRFLFSGSSGKPGLLEFRKFSENRRQVMKTSRELLLKVVRQHLKRGADTVLWAIKSPSRSLALDRTIPDELSAVILAHRSKSPRTLENLRKNFIDNWYVLYGIANNANASAITLDRIVKGEQTFTTQLQKLYSGFAWRNILLYAAKNRSTSLNTLNYIREFPKSRRMDIAAADKSIAYLMDEYKSVTVKKP